MDFLAYGRVDIGTDMDSPARRACWPTAISWLAYIQRGWPTANTARAASEPRWHGTDNGARLNMPIMLQLHMVCCT